MRIYRLLLHLFLLTAIWNSSGAMQYPSSDSLFHWLDTHIDQAEDSTAVYQSLKQAINSTAPTMAPKRKALLFRYFGKYHKLYGNLDSSVLYFERSIGLFKQINDQKALAATFLESADVYNLQARYKESMERVYAALDIYEKLEDKRGQARSYAYICDLLYYEDKYDESRDYCNQAIEIQQELDAKADLALSYYYRSCSELFSDLPLDSSLLSITKSLDIYHSIHEQGVPLLKALNWRGNVYKYMEQYEEAQGDYKSTLETAQRIGNNHYIITSLANIGHVLLLLGKYAEALPYNLEAISLMEKTGDKSNLWENYLHVADSYEHLGNLELALKYQKKYSTAYDGYLESIIERLETEAKVKYETRKKEETILSQSQKINQQRKFQWLYLSVAGLLAALLAVTYFTLKNIRTKRAALVSLNTKLDARNHQNELLLREINHRVKNNLEIVKSLISLQSAQLEDETSREAMQASQNRVQSMGIIHQKLYQGNQLGSIEMKDYFINLGQSIIDSFGADGRVRIICVMDELDLDVDTAVPIGLIVNELLTNSLKYAFPGGSSGQIVIHMNHANDHTLSLKVEDNGIGWKPDNKPKGTGFGSQLIRLLTQQLNGVVHIESSGGTTVSFQFNEKV